MWKSACLPLAFLLLFPLSSSLAQEKKTKKIFRIAVFQFRHTQSSEKDQKGFEKALADAGFKDKINVVFERQNAQGNPLSAQTIAQRLFFEKSDLIHTITPVPTEAVAKMIKDTPIVFSLVVDPAEAGIVPKTISRDRRTGTNITGVSHRWPISRQMEMYAKLLPKVTRWGTIYHQGDLESLRLIQEMRKVAKQRNAELLEAVISNDEEAVGAASFLAGKVQALYLVYDETVLASLESIVKICNEKKVPLLTSDLESVSKGALAAYGLDFLTIGQVAGEKALRILRGEEPGHIPLTHIETLHLIVNEKAARAQGVVLSPEFFKRSKKVITQERSS